MPQERGSLSRLPSPHPPHPVPPPHSFPPSPHPPHSGMRCRGLFFSAPRDSIRRTARCRWVSSCALLALLALCTRGGLLSYRFVYSSHDAQQHRPRHAQPAEGAQAGAAAAGPWQPQGCADEEAPLGLTARRTIVSSAVGALAGPASVGAKAGAGIRTPLDDLTPTMDMDDIEAAAEPLSKFQRDVMFKHVPEEAFKGLTVNGYPWDTKAEGVYVSAISGTPLFSSATKYEADNGRANFWAPIKKADVVEALATYDAESLPLWLCRTEVVDRASLTHLGFVYDDDTTPSKKRYVVKLAAMRFVPGPAPAGDKTQVAGAAASSVVRGLTDLVAG